MNKSKEYYFHYLSQNPEAKPRTTHNNNSPETNLNKHLSKYSINFYWTRNDRNTSLFSAEEYVFASYKMGQPYTYG